MLLIYEIDVLFSALIVLSQIKKKKDWHSECVTKMLHF